MYCGVATTPMPAGAGRPMRRTGWDYRCHTSMTSHELFVFMPPQLATEIVDFAYAEDKPLYRTTLDAVARMRKVRTVFLERQPRSQRHATVATTLTRPTMEMVAQGLLRTWLLKKYKAMLIDFLDALNISHEDGVVEDLPEKVEDEVLHQAVEKLFAKYPTEVVATYLHCFDHMNQPGWANLSKLLESDARFQF